MKPSTRLLAASVESEEHIPETIRSQIHNLGADEALVTGQIDAYLDPVTGSAFLLHEAEEALRQSERKFASAFEFSATGMALVAPDGTFTAVNAALCAMLGYLERELVGRKFQDITHPDDLEGDLRLVSAMLAGAIPTYQMEKRYLSKSGTVVWTTLSVSLHRDAMGEPVHFISQIQDINQRKKAENDIRMSVKRLELAADVAEIGVWEWNVSTNELTWDARMYEIYSIPPDTHMNYELWRARVHPDDFTEQDTRLHRIVDDKSRGERQFRILLEGTTVRYIQAAETVTTDEAGTVSSVVGVNIDITERLLRERAARTLAERQSDVAEMGLFALTDTSIDNLLERAVAVAAKGLNAAFCKILRVGADGSSAMLTAGIGWKDGWVGRRAISGDALKLNYYFLETRAPVVVEDFDTETRFRASEMLKAHNIRSGLDVPIKGGLGIHGSIGIYSEERRKFTAEDIDFVQSLANIAATAIERDQANLQLARLAQFDALTGLPNRVLFLDRLMQAALQAQSGTSAIAVVLADLDHFKAINDTFGHALGDDLLVQVSERLRDHIPLDATIGRMGGDEFGLIFSNVGGTDHVALLVQAVSNAMAQPFTLKGESIFVTASFGISMCPDNGFDAGTLIKNADTAMYRAKVAGRGGFQFHLQKNNDRAIEKMRINSELHGALERDEFRLVYQPKVNLKSGKIVGFEALLRWEHPSRGQVAPVEFISTLEETGLIVQVGEWVIRSACEQLNAWRAQGIEPPPIAVNLSARQFYQKDLDSVIKRILRESGVEAKFLELELTESMLMDAEAAVRILNSLRSSGVKLMIDDFGVGYSSLTYLKHFPLDTLKIDRSFIRDVMTRGDDAAITESIIRLAHSLNLTVVAEGVETADQLSFLRAYRCDEIQGYYFARPLSVIDSTRSLVENWHLEGMTVVGPT